jgi:hypothetical protein
MSQNWCGRKNAGPFWLTIDIMFDDAEAYRHARDAEIVNRAPPSRAFTTATRRNHRLRGRLLYAWRDKVRTGGPAALARAGTTAQRGNGGGGPGGCGGAQDRPAAGSTWIFSASLATSEGDTVSQRRAWRRAVYEVIQTMTSSLSQGQVTIERLCRLARVSRPGYYRLWQTSAPRQCDTAVRDAIQRLVLANGRYRRGYRYITRQLRYDGLIVNHKRVLRLMRDDNLLGLRRRPFVPSTTEARHPWPVVPNLARGMQLSDLDHLWVADITYIRFKEEFAYLAVILDAFSCPLIGWAMADHLGASLAVAARRPPWGSLVHHSDAACSTPVPSTTACWDPRDCRQHEPGRQPLRQRQGRALHQNPQERRD